MQPIYPMLFLPYNYCPRCKMNTIELYSWHNYPQHYAKALEYHELNGSLPQSFDKYGIFTMRCSKCGKEYKIVWKNGVPRPIVDNYDINEFMMKFKSDYTIGKPNIIDNVYEMKMEE